LASGSQANSGRSPVMPVRGKGFFIWEGGGRTQKKLPERGRGGETETCAYIFGGEKKKKKGTAKRKRRLVSSLRRDKIIPPTEKKRQTKSSARNEKKEGGCVGGGGKKGETPQKKRVYSRKESRPPLNKHRKEMFEKTCQAEGKEGSSALITQKKRVLKRILERQRRWIQNTYFGI